MTKLTLTFVNRTERTSTRTNKPYTSLSLKAKEYGENYLSGFGNKDNANWKVGDEVEVLEVKEVQKDGKTYYNFDMPKSNGGVSPETTKKLDEILNYQTKIKLLIEELVEWKRNQTGESKAVIPGTNIPYPVNDGPQPNFEDDGLEHLNPDHIPF